VKQRSSICLEAAVWTCFGVLVTFVLAGSRIFKAFRITLPAFKIARPFIPASL
jgi:small neutral amino acid transporter SnatA (MarC family)